METLTIGGRVPSQYLESLTKSKADLGHQRNPYLPVHIPTGRRKKYLADLQRA